jgi:hypothetical protein
VTAFSKGKGWQISLPVPEMRPGSAYDHAAAAAVVSAIHRLCRLDMQLPREA